MKLCRRHGKQGTGGLGQKPRRAQRPQRLACRAKRVSRFCERDARGTNKGVPNGPTAAAAARR
jgi:hypothetical protein